MPVIIIPPGTTTFFSTARDELGNEYYVGSYTVVPPSATEPVTISPTYASAPEPTTVDPAPPEPPGSRVFESTILDGIRVAGGDFEFLSTGEVRPTTATGWTNSKNAIGDDSNLATATGTPELILSGFSFNIPAGATISGVKVRVKRSKV